MDILTKLTTKFATEDRYPQALRKKLDALARGSAFKTRKLTPEEYEALGGRDNYVVHNGRQIAFTATRAFTL